MIDQEFPFESWTEENDEEKLLSPRPTIGLIHSIHLFDHVRSFGIHVIQSLQWWGHILQTSINLGSTVWSKSPHVDIIIPETHSLTSYVSALSSIDTESILPPRPPYLVPREIIRPDVVGRLDGALRGGSFGAGQTMSFRFLGQNMLRRAVNETTSG